MSTAAPVAITARVASAGTTTTNAKLLSIGAVKTPASAVQLSATKQADLASNIYSSNASASASASSASASGARNAAIRTVVVNSQPAPANLLATPLEKSQQASSGKAGCVQELQAFTQCGGTAHNCMSLDNKTPRKATA